MAYCGTRVAGMLDDPRDGRVGPLQEIVMGKEHRGFASMDRDKQREIASKGGRAAHVRGTAHEWTSEQAREAGRKGGLASRTSRHSAQSDTMTTPIEPSSTVNTD